MRTILMSLLAVLVFAASAFAQIKPCFADQQPAEIKVGGPVTRPTGFGTAVLGILGGQSLDNVKLGDIGSEWTPQQVATIGETQKMQKSVPLALVWISNGGRCEQAIRSMTEGDTSPSPASPAVSSLPGKTYQEDECALAGDDWRQKLGRGVRVTVIVLKEALGVCYQSTQRPTQGDPIYVGVFTRDLNAWDGVRATFEPCALEPATPNILASGQLPTLRSGQQSATWALRPYPPKACFNPAVVVTVHGPQQITHTVRQATRYRATLHVGTVFTENHEATFGLRPDGTANKVFNEGPVDKGPEYVAAVVFYSALKYLPALIGKPSYPGRDPVADNDFVDKIGVVMGVGLRNPLKRYMFGGSFEVAAGVNLLGVWEWGETNVLAGINEGDVFTGAKEAIPVQKEWRRRFVFGVSLDIVYATAALTR